MSHGDVKKDNFFFVDEGQPGADEKAALCDFQLATICSPVRDLAYYIVLCLGVEERREHLPGLVKCYCAELKKNGIDFSEEQVLRDLPKWLLWPLLMDCATATGTRKECESYRGKQERGESVTDEEAKLYDRHEVFRQRTFAAIEDFDVEAIVSRLGNDCGVPFMGCCCYWALK
jgi:thiamine kinase-like enzyme